MNNEGEDPVYEMNNQMKDGGEVSGFKQYNAPSHEQGGQLVNNEGVPTNNGDSEIEGTENVYRYSQLPDKSGKNYVFSDANQTSDMVKGIIAKYKNKNTESDPTAKAAMEMEIKGAENINEALNAAKGAVDNFMMKYGGNTKYYNGGDLGVPEDLQVPTNQMQFADDNVIDNTPLNTGEEVDLGENLNPDLNYELTPGNKRLFEPLDLSNLRLDKGLRAAGLIAGGIDALQPAAKDKTIMPDFSQSDARFDEMNAQLEQARQDVTGASNRASELNRNASSSYSQYRARELGNIANLQDQLGRVGMQEQQMQNQIRGQQGQYEMNKAMTERNIRQENQIANLQNTARSQDIKRQFMSDVVAEADRLSTATDIENISAAKIEEGMALIGMLAPDMDVNKNMITNLIKVSKGQMKPENLSDEELIVFTRLNG